MLTRHRCDKGVTPARIIGDEPPARAAVAKRFAQRRDMDPERTVVDDRIGPRAGNESILVDRLAGAFDQRGEDVQGPAAEPERFLIIEQQSLRGDQPERPEDEGLLIDTRYGR